MKFDDNLSPPLEKKQNVQPPLKWSTTTTGTLPFNLNGGFKALLMDVRQSPASLTCCDVKPEPTETTTTSNSDTTATATQQQLLHTTTTTTGKLKLQCTWKRQGPKLKNLIPCGTHTSTKTVSSSLAWGARGAMGE